MIEPFLECMPWPAGTAVTPEGQDGPRYMLTGEAALAGLQIQLNRYKAGKAATKDLL